MCVVRNTGGGRGLCGGAEKVVDGVFPRRSQSFRYQRRPVSDCSSGRQGMAQDGGTRGGTFHGELDCCREDWDWTTAYSGMPERAKKDQVQDKSRNQVCLGWFARRSLLASSGVNLYPPGVWSADAMLSFSGVTFILFLFYLAFVLMLSLKLRHFVRSFFDMHAPRQPHAVTNHCLRPFFFSFFFSFSFFL